MKTTLHRADTRGHADHGWLNAHHSFSFANYYNPERMNFGALRVLNDDIVSGGMGFGMHPHDNMEIITIPLRGDLEHKDSMGNTGRIKNGEIQVMSAGTGIFHSEYNPNKDQETNLLQIWLFPNERNVEPRYDQISIEDYRKKNELYQVVSPDVNGQGTWIHQDAWFNLGDFDKGTAREYHLKKEGNGVYLFVMEGSVSVNGQTLDKRDAYGVWDTDKISITAENDARFLLMDVPMAI
ncbi:pirin family protein [Sinomicrobium weinanense]|uniref:Pirin family protein n=1 Tax=Sinomicrobium weinanense TaxID=2842200 RepID=A0A926JR25_9FLAO|nr:pirin family protein [Sinomicrobium weinanense]MBC9795681.1 pirin family protein [Sinomicrobium weinanense]MBU3122850.1 pirin family protein [Sinomicrobium weinanense]